MVSPTKIQLYLNSNPVAEAHTRLKYARDGDYVFQPNIEQVFETAYDLINESDPEKYPKLI